MDVEKWAIFCKVYRGAIRDDEPADEIDTSGLVLTHYKLTKASEGSLKLAGGLPGQLKGVTDVGSSTARTTKYGLLEEVLRRRCDIGQRSDKPQPRESTASILG